jgi:hypothetical protein
MSKSANANTPANRFGLRSVIIAILVLIMLLMFAPICTSDFVLWDDDVNITENEQILRAELNTLGWFWFHMMAWKKKSRGWLG